MKAAAPPPLDSVLLWVTRTIERDYIERAVFPVLREGNAQTVRSTGSEHHVTLLEAWAVLEDAIGRYGNAGRTTRNAFRSHRDALIEAIKEAEERPAIFAATSATCVSGTGDCWSVWVGSKDALQTHGIRVRGDIWPYDDGGKKWKTGTNKRGYVTQITRCSPVWPGLYRAAIRVPYEVTPADFATADDPSLIEPSPLTRAFAGVDELGEVRVLHMRRLPAGWRLVLGGREASS